MDFSQFGHEKVIEESWYFFFCLEGVVILGIGTPQGGAVGSFVGQDTIQQKNSRHKRLCYLRNLDSIQTIQ